MPPSYPTPTPTPTLSLFRCPILFVLQGQYTSLMHAAEGGHPECTQMLIKAGSDLTAKDWVRYEQCVGEGEGQRI